MIHLLKWHKLLLIEIIEKVLWQFLVMNSFWNLNQVLMPLFWTTFINITKWKSTWENDFIMGWFKSKSLRKEKKRKLVTQYMRLIVAIVLISDGKQLLSGLINYECYFYD